METPSSTKRVTRSQTLLASNNTNTIPLSKKEKMEDSASKSKGKINQDRSALVDITNDSPIVGLAKDCNLETPSSAIAKQRSNRIKNKISTPGSGEALLRGQVKTLLQKVEEEAEISKISFENRPFLHLQGFLASPMGLLAPTPANTPQLPNFDSAAPFTPLPVIEEKLKICQVVSEIFKGKKEESSTLESQKSLTRSLLLDFSEKSEVTDPSSSECYSGQTNSKDDDACIQDASVRGDEEEDYCDPDEDYDYEYDDDCELVTELCEKIGNMRVSEAAAGRGKHTRFLYNSDDEIVEEEVLHLKGLPTPTGKHLRFPSQDAAED